MSFQKYVYDGSTQINKIAFGNDADYLVSIKVDDAYGNCLKEIKGFRSKKSSNHI